MGASFDRLRCEVFQNLFLSPMNTGFVRPAVATVLTVYGIETRPIVSVSDSIDLLQQYLPFTVLKLAIAPGDYTKDRVATVLTVYGIETHLIGVRRLYAIWLQQYLPFTVLKREVRSRT